MDNLISNLKTSKEELDHYVDQGPRHLSFYPRQDLQVNYPRRILVIGGSAITLTSNHRFHHLISYLDSCGLSLDVIGRENFYTGPRANAMSRFLYGFSRLLYSPIKVTQTSKNRCIIVHNLPGLFGKLAQELWTYLQIKTTINSHYSICVFGHPHNALLAVFLKRYGIVDKIIYDDWDYYPAHIATANGFLSSILIKLREKMCINNADLVISVSRKLAELRRAQGAKRVLIIPNGVDYDLFSKAQQKKAHPPTLVFTGSLFSAWGVDLPIRALPEIRSKIPNIRFLVIGSGPDEKALQDLAYRDLKLEQCVVFLGRHDYHQLPIYLSEADIGILTYRTEEFVKYASSLKAYEYMAAGLPVLATRFGETAELIEESHAGMIVDIDPKAFAEAAIELLQNPKLYQYYSINAINLAKKFDWNNILAPIIELINNNMLELDRLDNSIE